jgi:aerobic-type carbon monoxide dehydrogenase small subunit (CoxS/CutS family)
MDKGFDLNVNGQKRRVEAEPETSLLEALRNDLGLTGSKFGCGEGACGACTVLVDGVATRSCVTPLSNADGKAIRTIESLEQNGRLHPIQQAFIDEGAMQCGYCTAGMIMSAHALLARIPAPTDEQIVEHMDGNVCRCGGYPRIVAAIKRASTAMRGAK